MAVAAFLVGLGVPSALGQRSGEVVEEGETLDGEIAVPNLIGGSVATTDNAADNVAREHRFADWLWELPRLVDNPDAPLLQQLRIIGRYHGQYARVDSNRGDFGEWETRRARLGINVRFFKYFTLQSEWKVDGDEFKFDKSNVNNQWLAWRRWEAFGVKVGQQKPLWSQEWSTSSNALLTMERSLLVNQLRPLHSLGIYASGKVGHWAYGAGAFRGDVGERVDTARGSFLLFNVARDFGDWLTWLDDARWRIDYVHNSASTQVAGGEYADVFATSVSGKLGRGRFRSEVIYAPGGTLGGAFGFTLTPSLDLIPDKLQLVVRYHHAQSNGDALKLQDRYETASGLVGDGRGDRYDSIYAGLNWYLRGNKLKFMSGVEYADMSDPNNNGGDYSGWSFLGGVRLSF